jgi:hypothetical protein
MHCAIIYNKACALARYSYEDAIQRKDLIAQCLNTLKEAASRFGLVTPSVIDDDLTKPDGAFVQLDSQTKMSIAGFKSELTLKRATPLKTLTWKQRTLAALKIMIGGA